MAKSKVRFVPLKLSTNVSIAKKRVKQANGKTVSVSSLDTESPKFDSELSAIFAENVARARRENSALSLEVIKLAKLTDLDKLEANYVKARAQWREKRKARANKPKLKASMAG